MSRTIARKRKSPRQSPRHAAPKPERNLPRTPAGKPTLKSARGHPPSDVRANPLIKLFHRRWLVPSLAALHQLKGAKFITLLNRLETNRPALKQTLDEGIQTDLVMKNPGYGHPLRPEYILTDAGRTIAPTCIKLMERLEFLDVEDISLRKWSLPVVLAIGVRARRFGEIRAHLGPITDRALTLALRDLTEADLITRTVIDSYPPAPHYQLAANARPLLAILRKLSRRAIL